MRARPDPTQFMWYLVWRPWAIVIFFTVTVIEFFHLRRGSERILSANA